MKTLICLLSDQPVPNLLSCSALKPNRIFLVETFKMQEKKASENFKHALKLLDARIPEPEVIHVSKGKDNDFPTLKNCIQTQILNVCQGDHFDVNLTGGTKPMSIALYEVFRDVPNAVLYYVELSRPREIQHFLTGETTLRAEPLSLDVFLAGYGYEFVQGTLSHAKRAEKTASLRALSSKKIATYCNIPGFRMWNYDNQKVYSWKEEKMNSGEASVFVPKGYLRPSELEVSNELARMFRLARNRSDGSLTGILSSNDIRYIDGGWLEEFIWNTLSPLTERYGMQDLHLGLEIRKKGVNGAKNELDVSFMRDSSFHILECKTGIQQKMQENTYKIFAVGQQLRALGVKTYLISNSPNLEHVRERANIQKTTPLDAQKIYELTVDPEKVLDELFAPR